MRLGEKQYIGLSLTKKQSIKRTAFLCLFIFLLFATLVYALSVIRPAFLSLAEAKAKKIAVKTMNEAVLSSFAENEEAYQNLIAYTYDAYGDIGAVNSNLTEINQLKARLNLDMISALESLKKQRLTVPIGNLTGNDLFAGLGPDLSFYIKPYGTAECDIVTDFSEMGINHTKLDISVSVRADVSVLAPSIRKMSTVTSTVPVISTVIVGDVPESYTNIDREGAPYEEDLLEVLE